MSIFLLIISIGLLWLLTCRVNYLWYNKLFADSPKGMDRDLLVLLGPIGSLMLALVAGLMAYNNICNRLGERFANAHNILLVVAVFIVPWIGAGVANHIWFGRIFPDSKGMDMPRDFVSALGPIGSFMLLLCFLVDRVLRFAETAKA